MKCYSHKGDNLTQWIPEFDHNFIHERYKTAIRKDYFATLMPKNKIDCENIKKLYNKYNSKCFFEKHGLNVPSLYYYSNSERDVEHILSFKKQYVAKPAHMSENDGIFINDEDYVKVNKSLNENINKAARDREPDMMKQAEKGMLIEEFIDYDYEFKVFVLYGCPLLGDLRRGPKEWHREAIIDKDNTYFNWDKEYDTCKAMAKELKIDYFRIDFFYSKKEDKFYAGEMAFRPSTYFGDPLHKFILDKWKSVAKY